MGWRVNALPKIDRKTKTQIGFRWDVRRYNPHNRRYEPVAVSDIPAHIRNATSNEVVEAFCRQKSAEEDAISARIRKRIAWRDQYQNMDRLLSKFTEYQRERAPNSWENDVHYLEKYVFNFFLEKSPWDDSNNILNWYLHYEDFRRWLAEVQPFKCGKEVLSRTTQNRVIKALNVFLTMVGLQVGQSFSKCPTYKRSEANQVTAEDIPSEEEIVAIQKALLEIREDSHDLFTILVRTALRENEGLGLSLAFLYEGRIDGEFSKKIHLQLEKYDLDKYYGYICLESQPALSQIRA